MQIPGSTIRILSHHINAAYLSLALVEVALFSACAVGGVQLYHAFVPASPLRSVADLGFDTALFAGLALPAVFSMGLYEPRQREAGTGILFRALGAFSLVLVAAMLFSYLSPGAPEMLGSRGSLICAMSLALSVVLVNRACLPNVIRRRVEKRRVLVLGGDSAAREIKQKMRRGTDRPGFVIVGIVPLSDLFSADSDNAASVATHGLLERVVRDRVDELVVAADVRPSTGVCHVLEMCRECGVLATDIVDFFEKEAGRILVDHVDQRMLINQPLFPTARGLEPLGKRAFDLVASFVLLMIGWPLMVVASMAIVLEDGLGAPVIYRQRRVGRDGRVFELLKFRTMQVDAEFDGRARWAVSNDTRVTQVGAFLRRTRIDELPQILNVLSGDMAVVGPRPERPEFVRELIDKIPHYASRHCVKPGITGWAQIHYPYGSSEKDSRNKTEFDLYYVKNCSLFLDALVLLQTAEVVVFAKRAR